MFNKSLLYVILLSIRDKTCTRHLTVMMSAAIILVSALLALSEAGITIPKDDCRWLVAEDFETDLKCDGNEVAVGSCASGFEADFPGY